MNVLKTLDFFRRRKRGYQLVFGSPAGEEVLKDLARFCFAAETTYDNDARLHARFEGRREVFMRISQQLHLTTEQLFALYNQQGILTEAKHED